jgi:alkylation response protein AidB-like acyl-CoA dehydrogenase
VTDAYDELHGRFTDIAQQWRADRSARQQRRHLDRADFDDLASAGYLLLAVPRDQGGLWESVETSTRPTCEVLRALARADSSVALVSSMHPAVLSYWLSTPDESQPAWEEQRRAVFASAAEGARWGTITSEPGSGGDIMRTRTLSVAAGDVESSLPGERYRLSGDKHFGSGLGIVDYMLTTALVDGEDAPSAYLIGTRGLPDASVPQLTVTAEWDGAGMAATQSHAARLAEMPAVRLAWDRPIEEMTFAAGPAIGALFTAVVLGVLDEAVAVARAQLEPRRESLRAYEQVEWAQAELEHWLAVQAYEGALRAVEHDEPVDRLRAVLRGKAAVAQLAEHSLGRITRVLGGGTFSRRSPFSAWYEDVRALGFLRPPWALAFDQLYATSF